ASGDPASVLACELPLADALRATRGAMRHVTAFEGRGPVHPANDDAADVRRLLTEARAAVERCRRLGETVVVMATATANAPNGYGRSGVPLGVHTRATMSSRT